MVSSSSKNRLMDGVDDDLLDQIFDVMIRDFSKFALQIYANPAPPKNRWPSA
jgi:hypothetical protein